MSKKNPGKHLQFYLDCIGNGRMPRHGLCSCAWNDFIDEELLLLFKPEYASKFSYWAGGVNLIDHTKFTKLRQCIVLFMAAINGEL